MIDTSDTIIADVTKGALPQNISIDIFADVDDITVYEINETTGESNPLVLGSGHFTLSTADEWNAAGSTVQIQSGGTLSGSGWLTTNPTRYVVMNSPAREQTDDISNTGNFDGPTFEHNWDRLALQVKELDEKIRTCIRYPAFEGSADNEVGTLVEAKNALLGGNATTGRPEWVSKTGLLTSIQSGLQASKTVAIGGSSNFASVALTSQEESVMVEIVATTELGASVRHIYMVTRESGASNVTATKFRDTIIDDIEATQEIDIGTSVSTNTVTFSIDGTAFTQSTDVDAVLILTQLKASSNHTLVAV